MNYRPIATIVGKPFVLPVFDPSWKQPCQTCRHLVEVWVSTARQESAAMLCRLQPRETWQAEVHKRPHGYAWAARFEQGGVCGEGAQRWEGKE